MEAVSPVSSTDGSTARRDPMSETEQIEVRRLDVTEVHAQLDGLAAVLPL